MNILRLKAEEAALRDLISDPMVQAVMASDGVTEADIYRAVSSMRANRSTATMQTKWSEAETAWPRLSYR